MTFLVEIADAYWIFSYILTANPDILYIFAGE